ncbi:beta-1,3-galactosyltransferase 6-like [Rhizophagus clarus]|uniref:Beta-1,3-galactosyltransferase 6-like n=1 Tax=Rhizophagus clarus TaxID=94130 RepID=A0A8H3LP22_9GLOM|nr:beta-1,3-galactosyltransferase 6-like [Rhizophagus clarus]
MMSHLPSFRPRPIGIPRRFYLPLFFLRGLSIVPATYSFFSCISYANYVNERDADGFLELRSTELDYWLGATWFNSNKTSFRKPFILQNFEIIIKCIFSKMVSSAIIRLISLQAINWVITAIVITHYGPDEPIWAWMICSVVLAVCNTIQWLFTSTTKYQKADEPEKIRQLIVREIFRYIVIPLAIFTFITMIHLLEQQSRIRYNSNLGLTTYKLNTNLSLNEIRSDSNVKVIMIVLSSWTESGYKKRQTFRDTSVKLFPQNSKKFSIAYRFILGDAPSSKAQMNMGQKLLDESERYGDIIIVPTSDTHDNLSRKVYKGFEWSNKYAFDYIVKTNDDVFVRMDIVSHELQELGPDKKYYWRGLSYWNIPARNAEIKSAAFGYKLPIFPPFTAGTFYILSRDIISLLVTDAPRLFTKNDDQNLGIWLFPYNIKPIHDRRIQQTDVCEDDMIAKHFGGDFEGDQSMKDIYENVTNNKRMCEGFKQRFCALCYPCWGRENHWKDLNFDCDEVKGITLLNQSTLIIDNPKYSVAVFDDPMNVTMGSEEDKWIIPGLLSQHSSVYSRTNQWYLLHWVCWTTDPSTFQERHYKAIELIWVHTPKAIVFVLTTTLPQDFFSEYQNQGYMIHVIKFSKELVLERQWFLGQNSKNWLRDWNKLENNQFFSYHLTDYMRYLLLYKYGGVYMDIDALWIRAPPDTNIEFIGSDSSNVSSDFEWTLDKDGTYLVPGVMRFKKGWSMFREIMEQALSPSYSPSCFNCIGSRAITIYVKEYREVLERHGLLILPSHILCPRNYIHIDKLLRSDPIAQEEFQKIGESSWNIHLFGRSTNYQLIEDSSVIGLTLKKFSLDVPHASAPLIAGGKPHFHNSSYPFVLEGPKKYRFTSSNIIKGVNQYTGSLNGQFQGLNVIFIRGGPPMVNQTTIKAKALNGKLSFNLHGGDWSESSLTINNSTKKDVNALLNTLIYRPNDHLRRTEEKDDISLEVTYGDHQAKLIIEIEIPIWQDLDSNDESLSK